jgi:hypothetical protein
MRGVVISTYNKGGLEREKRLLLALAMKKMDTSGEKMWFSYMKKVER